MYKRSPFATAFIPILGGWRVLASLVLAAWLITTAIVLIRGRSYEATALLTPVSSRQMSVAGGLAASLIGAQALGGVQATPAFIVRLARMNGVLASVAASKISANSDERIGDRLLKTAPGRASLERMTRSMRDLVNANYDAATGIVTVRVAHRDSALARLVLDRVVGQVSESFVRASRAQASEIRKSLDLRVDSSAKQLHRAEEDLLTFNASNRVVSPFSPASIDRERLQRAVDVAQTVYMQAVNDREAAVAKELEETPAVVTLDPPPAVLPPEPRGLITKLIFASILAVSLGSLFLIGRARVRSGVVAAAGEDRELAEAIRKVPGMGRLVLGSRSPQHTFSVQPEVAETPRVRSR